jgi:hypothetical protein
MKNTANHPLLDALIDGETIRSDADIARALGIAAPQISKTRHGHVEVSDIMRVAIMRKFKWSLKRIDELAPPAATSEE